MQTMTEQTCKTGHSAGGVRTTLASVVDQAAFSNSCGIPLAALVDFDPIDVLNIPRVPRQGARCQQCRAYLNKYCQFDTSSGAWQCALCGASNAVRVTNPNAPKSVYAELCEEAVEFDLDKAAQSRPGAAPVAAFHTHGTLAHLVVVIDTNLDNDAWANLRTALPAALKEALPGDSTLVSVIGCDTVATFYPLNTPRPSGGDDDDGAAATPAVQADIMRGDVNMDEDSVISLNERSPSYVARLGEVAGPHGRLHAVLEGMRCLHTQLPVRERPRCLAVAMEAGLRLIASCGRMTCGRKDIIPHMPHHTRLLVITSGPCTLGPGTVPLVVLDHDTSHGSAAPGVPAAVMDKAKSITSSLAAMAQALHVPIDIYSVAEPSVNVALLSELAEATGGVLVHHPGTSRTLQRALQVGLTRCWGAAGILDCYPSKGLKVSHWFGPVAPVQESMRKVKGVVVLSQAAVALGMLCDGQGAVARLELTKDLKGQQHVYVQMVLHYYDSLAGTHVIRIVTRVVKVVSTIRHMLQGLDPVAAAVEASKKVVSDAIASGAHRSPKQLAAARTACAAQLSLLASRFGKVQVKGGIFAGRRLQQLPPQLVYLAQSLHALQRGQVLGPTHHGQPIHPEARLQVMRSLITSNSVSAAAITCPALYGLIKKLDPSPREHQQELRQEQQQQQQALSIRHLEITAVSENGTPIDPVQLQPPTPQAVDLASVRSTSQNDDGNAANHLQQNGQEVGNGTTSGSTVRSMYKLVPLPSLDVVLSATERLLAASQTDQMTDRGPGSVTQEPLLMASFSPVLILDLGTQIIGIVKKPAAAASENQDATNKAGTKLEKPRSDHDSIKGIHDQILAGLLDEALPVQLLDRFPLPEIVIEHIEEVLEGRATAAEAVTHCSSDQQPQQLVQLCEPQYCASAVQYGGVAGNAVVPNSRAEMPGLFNIGVHLLKSGLSTWVIQLREDAGQDVKQRKKPKDLTVAPTSLVQWCSDLGVLLPSTTIEQ